MLKQPEYLPLAKAARKCGVDRKTFRRWLEADGFILRRNGHTQLIPLHAFEAVVAARVVRQRWGRAEKGG